MLKYRQQTADKGEFLNLPSNITILSELNFGPLWVRLADGRDALLYGADLNAWMGTPTENLYCVIGGVDAPIPASTRMVGVYQRTRKVVDNPRGEDVVVGAVRTDAIPLRPDIRRRETEPRDGTPR